MIPDSGFRIPDSDLPNVLRRGRSALRNRQSAIGDRQSRDGFSLLELVTALGVATVVLTLGLQAYLLAGKLTASETERAARMTAVGELMEQFKADVRAASAASVGQHGRRIALAGRHPVTYLWNPLNAAVERTLSSSEGVRRQRTPGVADFHAIVSGAEVRLHVAVKVQGHSKPPAVEAIVRRRNP